MHTYLYPAALLGVSLNPGAMVKASKRKGMDVDGAKDEYTYGPSTGGGTKKKRLIKLSRAQMKRKQKLREKGENLSASRALKVQKDTVRAERRLLAKDLW